VFWIDPGEQKKPVQFAEILRRGGVSGGFGKGCRSGVGRMGWTDCWKIGALATGGQ